ncbi:MAG: DUF4105 domain-containing protein [Bdellovibrio sp.]|nr:DUF4105 domain-containing protein [Bdellovibrio sp.]
MHAKVHNLVLLFIFTLSFQLKTPHAWGFSFSTLQNHKNTYILKAKTEKLWEQTTWVRLGHYEKTLFGYQSSFKGPLFMDADGDSSPEKELLKTLEAFFSESKDLTMRYKRHPQCQFLARRTWLTKRLNIAKEDLLPCEERQAWKAQLNTQSISLIFAASDLGNPSSSYGHTFLKLINPENAKNKDLIDYGINYAADANSSEGILYAVKGLFGMYDGRFTMLPYHQKIREYINLEGRDIWEYPLNFSSAEVDFLVEHLLEMEIAKAPYWFFTDNCSYHILKTLEVIRPELDLSSRFTKFVIPIDTVKVVMRESNLVNARIFKKSLKTDYLESYSRLGFLQKKALEDAVEKLVIPSTYELSKKEEAEVYEAGMKYMAIQAYRTGKDFDDQVYKLSSERAVLGQITDEQKFNIQPPDESHDSSAIYLGSGQITKSDKNNLSSSKYYSLKFRAAFHDLEQPDFGTVHMSQTEMASFDFRYFTDIKKLSLYRFTVLDLINANPITQIDKNLSWKIKAAILDQWNPEIEGGGGMSFDFNVGESARVSYFITARTWQSDTVMHSAVGPEVLFMIRPMQDIGFSTSLTYFGVLKDEPFLRFKSKLNWNVAPNYDLQVEAENLVTGQTDFQMRAVKNFIF